MNPSEDFWALEVAKRYFSMELDKVDSVSMLDVVDMVVNMEMVVNVNMVESMTW